jgi:hypothetical protein
VTGERCCWPSCDRQRYGYLYVCRDHAEKVWRTMEGEKAEEQARAVERPPRLRNHERHGWVYYLEVGGRLKIGFAADLPGRLRAYPPESKLLARRRGTLADEQAEHQRCTPWRVAGREWYELNDSTRRIAAEAQQADYDAEVSAGRITPRIRARSQRRPPREEDRTD